MSPLPDAVDVAGVDQAEDVRVLQRGHRPDLRQKPLDANEGRELRAQHLDRDVPGVPEIGRDVDGRHAALPELALEGVAIGKPGLEPG